MENFGPFLGFPPFLSLPSSPGRAEALPPGGWNWLTGSVGMSSPQGEQGLSLAMGRGANAWFPPELGSRENLLARITQALVIPSEWTMLDSQSKAAAKPESSISYCRFSERTSLLRGKETPPSRRQLALQRKQGTDIP